ncbi:MAG TPA: hypothetical protein VK968_06665, partial [Roseimicrobium sp.]|nr:hypothetical protein [Roseimicrobium sp.]
MLEANQDGTALERALGLLLFTGGLCLCALLTWSFSQRINQIMVAGLLGAILIIISLIAPMIAITFAFVWLAILGDVRRLFVFETGVIDQDPLLLVGPLVAGAIALKPFLNGKLEFHSRLPRLILILMIIMLVEVINPLQGGLIIGVTGGMFYVVPLLWFWIGQAYGTEEHTKVLFYRVVICIGIAACVMGLYQTFIDFTPYQDEWIRIMRMRFLALNVGSRVRPFSFLVSPAEFAHYCMVLVVLAFAPLARGKLRPVVCVLPIAMTCIVLQGGRGPLVLACAACIAMWALSGKSFNSLQILTRTVISGTIAVALIVIGFGAVGADTGASAGVAPMLQRQAAGLLNPLDQRESTALDHVFMGINGVLTGVRYPFGMGLGASTIAGTKYAADEDSATG